MVLQKFLKILGNYTISIRDILPEMLQNAPLQVRQRLWFQYDGAPAHFALDVREYLNHVFPNSLDWEGWSSTVATTFSRSHSYGFIYRAEMKCLVYETPIGTPEELVACVAEAAAIIRERQSFARRYQLCINVNGRHFQQLL